MTTDGEHEAGEHADGEHEAGEHGDRVIILDREIWTPAGAISADVEVASRVPATPGSERGTAASEVVEPFVRAIEVLLRGLGDAVGETGSAARIELGSLLVEYSNAGWGDDTVRVSRRGVPRGDHPATRSGPGDAPELACESPAPERNGDRWEQGVAAAREGDHSEALALFEREAEQAAEQGLHQRAAIAYRSASREAGWTGRRDHGNKLLRLAGKHYLFVAESPETSAQGVVQAFVTAAKCFLQAGNLSLASAAITRALATSETLSAIA